MSGGNAEALARWGVGQIVHSTAVSHDVTLVASVSADSNVRLWDIHAGALVLEPLAGHTELVRSGAFSPDDARIASGSYGPPSGSGNPRVVPSANRSRDIPTMSFPWHSRTTTAVSSLAQTIAPSASGIHAPALP